MEKQISKKTSVIITVIISVVVAVLAFLGGFFTSRFFTNNSMDELHYIISMYRDFYYDQISDEEMVNLFADSLLDDYSDYYSKEEYDLIKKANYGEHVGVGMDCNRNTHVITRVNYNSRCDRAGIKVGGVITAIGATEESLQPIIPPSEGGEYGLLLSKIDEYPVGQNFVVQVDYNGTKQTYTIARETYTETFVRYYTTDGEYGFVERDNQMVFERMGDNNHYNLQGKSSVGLIKYTGFSSIANGLYGSVGQFARALEQFRAEGKQDIIIDLRNNGGGFLSILAEVSAHFICVEKNARVPVAVIKYKDRQTVETSARVDYSDYNFRTITILANVNTASASEAFIGAVLDYDKKDIVNVVIEGYSYKQANYATETFDVVTEYRSYGKGIMQTTYDNFLAGTAIKLTTAKIFWPVSDVSIHGVGVTTALNETLYSSRPKIHNASEYGAVYDAVSFAK